MHAYHYLIDNGGGSDYTGTMNDAHYDHQRIKALRREHKLTARQLAAEVGVKPVTIFRVESGKHASYKLLCILAHRFGVPVTSLLLDRPALSFFAERVS